MLSEILTALGLDETTDTVGFKCTILGKHGVYIEGVKCVVKFTPAEIVLRLKSGRLIVSGEDLTIKELSKGDAVVSGKISGVQLEKPKEL